MLDKIKITAGVLCVVLGLWAYYWFSGTPLVLRVLMVLGGLVLGGLVAWTSAPGKAFFVFARESWAEAGRVSWPTRKETVQTTAVVFAFVVVMALFLFAVDSSIAWVVSLITGRSQA
jgi:preprotein translocase subunit SecE